MFYYPTVLRHHTGCFSTIWLVATKGIRVPRRDFLKVNVKSTCDDIMNYVLERVPPPQTGLPRPRFSLYLSSQLQYGVVVVYHRQCSIFLGKNIFLSDWIKVMLSIDMDDQGRRPLNFPDALSLMEETEGALDPLFGVMHLQHPMPSPGTLIQVCLLLNIIHSFFIFPLDITASPDTITMRELEPVAIPITEDVSPPQVKRRKRQLIFFDPEVQIPQEVLQQQIDDPQTETRPPPLISPSSHRGPSVADLLNNPCTCQYHTCKKNIVIDSKNKFSGVMTVKATRLLTSRNSGLRSLLFAVFCFHTLKDENVIMCWCVGVCVCRLLPEVAEREIEPMLFQSLLPPEVDRRTVSNIFQKLLGKGSVSVIIEPSHYSF
uniref:Rad21/Rec8-like protein N-terminal domain-containing protein n=1 Tax=Seriola lalandi dorsalis TaxID=1841481 RepID=A0A3B4XMM2_SERLL